MTYEIHIPPTLLIGGGARKQAGDIASRLGMRKALLVSDKYLEGAGVTAEIAASLRASGVETFIFTDIEREPETADALGAAGLIKRHGLDSIVSVGGGSSIDTAKAASALATNGGLMSDYMGVGKVSKPGLPHLAIPTTAGTGSEVTRVTIITDKEKNIKMMCLDNAFMPAAAIVDFELSMSMPPALTSYVGIDALTHCIEAYVSAKANPVSDMFAEKAIRLISGSILGAYRSGADARFRSGMMEGATFAGIAFSNASVCAVHGMARPIGAYFGVAHGLSNAMLLPVVTERSIEGDPVRYARIARMMGLDDFGLSDLELNESLIRTLKELNKRMGIPGPAEYGIDRARYMSLLPEMAKAAIDSGSPGNNPKVFSLEEIIELYREVYDG